GLLRPRTEDVGVVAERVEVEEVRDTGAEARLGPRRPARLVRPLHEQPVELARRSGCAPPPARAVGVEVEDPERGGTLAERAARIARPHLPQLEERVDLGPARDPRDLDRLKPGGRPERPDQLREAGVDVVGAGRLARPALERRHQVADGDDREAEVLLRALANRVEQVVADVRDADLALEP